MTGGGTAGHVTPNIALIPALQRRGYDIHYLGTKDGIERKLIENVPNVTYHPIRSGKLRRYFSMKNFSDPFRVIGGYFDCRRVFKSIHPTAIFSKGGFVSVPVCIAGKCSKIPVVLHESDYTPGLANKIAIHFASKVLVTFEDTLPLTKGKGICTGTPIREGLLCGERQKGLSLCGFDGNKPVLLCMGGSQGAGSINEALRNALYEFLQGFDVIHICGPCKVSADHNDIRGYKQFDYVDDELSDLFACTDVVMSRAGANSVFEFLALSLPALLIPLPLTASRGDQIQNADYFKRKGYAAVLEQENVNEKTLVQSIEELYAAREQYIQNMKAASEKCGTNAVIAQICTIMDSPL